MNLAIIGASEMALELFNLIISCNEKNKYEKIFYVDLTENKEKHIISETDFFQTDRNKSKILIAMGEPFMRKKMLEKYIENGFTLTTFIHPLSFISNDTIVKEGSIIFPHVYIAQGTTIENNVAIHAGSKIENDCQIGDNCFISSNAFIGAKTSIKDTCFVGPGASIRDSLTIGRDTIIGIGSIVTKSIEDNYICFGNPAQPIRKNTAKRVFK